MDANNPRVTMLLQKCGYHHKTFAILTERREDGNWTRLRAFPVEESDIRSNPHMKTAISGALYCGDEYTGCPFCGAVGFVVCGCGKLICWDESPSTYCDWCHTTISHITEAETFNVEGNQDML